VVEWKLTGVRKVGKAEQRRKNCPGAGKGKRGGPFGNGIGSVFPKDQKTHSQIFGEGGREKIIGRNHVCLSLCARQIGQLGCPS